MPSLETLTYFADDVPRVYQLLQWLPVLEELDTIHPTGIVTRDPSVAAIVDARTDLPVFCVPGFGELAELLDTLDAKVTLYVNNGMKNFNALINARMMHVHIGHGESDKQSMISNCAKAYDRAFVAGEAAVSRHRTGLLEFDESKLVRIGRPQLDLRPEPLLPPSTRRTVLYAPTWEGDADYNCYSSVDVYGDHIVDALLALPDVRLVYKPHPRVATSLTPSIAEAHARILGRIDAAAAADPSAGHQAIVQGDILAVFAGCDLMVTDVSSVGLDWLYLQTDKPLVMTDRHLDGDRLRREVPVSRCADVIDGTVLDDLSALFAARLDHDEHRIARSAMRHHYFDGHGVGDSTRLFVDAISALVDRRDELVGVEDSSRFGAASA